MKCISDGSICGIGGYCDECPWPRIDGLEIENKKLRDAARNLLKDLEERVSNDGQYHPSDSVREYLGNGKILPVGNRVLFAMDKALEGKK